MYQHCLQVEKSKQPNSIKGWIDKQLVFVSAVRRNGILRHAAAYVNLENRNHGRTQNHKKVTWSNFYEMSRLDRVRRGIPGCQDLCLGSREWQVSRPAW